MKKSKAPGSRAGTARNLGRGVGTAAGRAGNGLGAGATAVGKRLKKAGEYIGDRVDVEIDLQKAVEAGTESYKRATGGNVKRVASGLKGAVKDGGIRISLREEPRSRASQGASHGGRSRKSAPRSARGSATRGASD